MIMPRGQQCAVAYAEVRLIELVPPLPAVCMDFEDSPVPKMMSAPPPLES